MHSLAAIELQHAIAQRAGHGHGQVGVRAFERPQITRLLLGNLPHARPFRIAIRDLHLLDGRQIDDTEAEMLRGRRPRLHVVFDVLRQAGEEELKARPTHLRLHGHLVPAGGALEAREKRDLAGLHPDQLRSHHLVAVAAHGGVARQNAYVVEGCDFMLRAGPKQRRPVPHGAGPHHNHPRKHARCHARRTKHRKQTCGRHQRRRRRIPGHRQRIRGKQFTEGILHG